VAAHRGRAGDQDRNHLDEAGEVVLRPDTVRKIRGSAAAAADAKLKAGKPAGYPNAGLYRRLAYSTVLGLRSGHLMYAKGIGHARAPRGAPVRHRDLLVPMVRREPGRWATPKA